MNRENFIEILKSKKSAPFLFLGSGFSKHYLETPTWEDLLAKFAHGPINMYRSLLDTNELSIIASKIAEEKTHDFWESIKKTSDSKLENLIKNIQSKDHYLKILISNYLLEFIQNGIPPKYTKELDYLSKLNIDGVITTNWDNLAENIFSKFNVFVGQEDLMFSNTFEIGEIYKIHGCVYKPKSLVLTKEDYDEFNEKNAYLAAKLITIFVEHPIIFFGYSLNDPNIQNLLESIVKCFRDDASKIEQFRDNLFFVEWSANEIQNLKIESHTFSIVGKQIPCIRILTHDYMPVYECLSYYEREIPASVLRLYKEKFYNIVCSEKTEKQIYAIEARDIDKRKDIGFVCGFGAIQKYLSNVGYTGLTANEVYKDIVEDQNYDAEQVLKNVLPRLRKNSSKYLPCYKYLSQLGIISKDTYHKNSYGINIDLLDATDFRKYDSFNNEELQKRLSQIIADYRDEQKWRAFALIPYSRIEEIDLETLRVFILDNMSVLTEPQRGSTKTYFRKLVCFFDWCKYGTWFRKEEKC